MNCFNNLRLKQRIAALTAASFIQAGLIGIMSRRPAISAPLPYGSKTVHLVSPQYDWQIIARTGYKLDGLTLVFNAPTNFGDVRMNEKGDIAFDAATQEKGRVIFLNGKAIARVGDMIGERKINSINSFFLEEDGNVDVFFHYLGHESCAYGAVERNGKLIFDTGVPYNGEAVPLCGNGDVVNSWDDREYYLRFDTQIPDKKTTTHILRHAKTEIENIPPNPHPSTTACSFNHKEQSVCLSFKDQTPYLVRDDQGVLPVPGIAVGTAINDSGQILTSNLEMFNYNDVVTGNPIEQGKPYYLKIPYTTLLKHPLQDFQAPFGNVERTDQGLLIVPQQTAGRVVLKENNSVLLVIANPFVYKDKPRGSQETIILKGTLKTAAQNPPQTQKKRRRANPSQYSCDAFKSGFAPFWSGIQQAAAAYANAEYPIPASLLAAIAAQETGGAGASVPQNIQENNPKGFGVGPFQIDFSNAKRRKYYPKITPAQVFSPTATTDFPKLVKAFQDKKITPAEATDPVDAADYAAMILEEGLVRYHGDLTSALGYYNGGRDGGDDPTITTTQSWGDDDLLYPDSVKRHQALIQDAIKRCGTPGQ